MKRIHIKLYNIEKQFCTTERCYASVKHYYIGILFPQKYAEDLDYWKCFFIWSFPTHPGMAQLERSAISGFSSKSRQSSFPYDVKREVYNEETFQQEHKRKASSSGNMNINITTFTHHVQCRCVCPIIQPPPSGAGLKPNLTPLVSTSLSCLSSCNQNPVVDCVIFLQSFLWFVL